MDWQIACREHALTADAIADWAPERVEQPMRAHIERSRRVLRAGFDSVTLPESLPRTHARSMPARPAR